MRARTAQLVVEAVNMLCPFCGEPQPNPDDGSHLWLPVQVEQATGRRSCVSCDAAILIVPRSTAAFR